MNDTLHTPKLFRRHSRERILQSYPTAGLVERWLLLTRTNRLRYSRERALQHFFNTSSNSVLHTASVTRPSWRSRAQRTLHRSRCKSLSMPSWTGLLPPVAARGGKNGRMGILSTFGQRIGRPKLHPLRPALAPSVCRFTLSVL